MGVRCAPIAAATAPLWAALIISASACSACRARGAVTPLWSTGQPAPATTRIERRPFHSGPVLARTVPSPQCPPAQRLALRARLPTSGRAVCGNGRRRLIDVIRDAAAAVWAFHLRRVSSLRCSRCMHVSLPNPLFAPRHCSPCHCAVPCARKCARKQTVCLSVGLFRSHGWPAVEGCIARPSVHAAHASLSLSSVCVSCFHSVGAVWCAGDARFHSSAGLYPTLVR
jgi:hypothetical protein